jgi:cysteine desulfurase
MIYLDHAATTPVRPEAVAAMLPYLTEHFGNPSGSHAVSRRARLAVDEARDTVAAALGCRPGEVVFTAGGTEADNLAVAGVVARLGGVPVCTATEHHAVLHATEALGGRIVAVDGDGVVDLDALADALDDGVSVVSVHLANNEVGTCQPLGDVAAVVREHAPRAILATDAVQAAPWLDVAVLAAPAALVAVAAHKLGGPKGVGALVVREGTPLRPILHGGGQERDRRSGTQNVAAIVAFAEALRLAVAERPTVVPRVRALRDRLADGVTARVPGTVETGRRAAKLPNNAHLRFGPGLESEVLLLLLDEAGVCASAGSACASGAIEPSHVLTAMGLDKADALSSLRLTLGRETTEAEVDAAVDAVVAAVGRARPG